MWILECDGDVLKHKRIWLRPGKTYLFGRTKPETGRYQTGFQINHKTVSRKHLILKISDVEPDDVGILAKRTEVVFEDADTKLGTVIDETKIKAKAKFTSIYDVHVFKLGGYEHSFKLVWKPVVFSYTFSSKEFKGGKDPLLPIRTRLAELDVKALPSYASGKTTHVITSKRNTSRGLQALIQNRRIVTEEFVGALEVAATPTDLAEAESFAPLETDFDAGWPNETQFLPAPGKEPGPKEAETYDPSPERKDIFNGMTFILFDTHQYDNLQAPITDGGGKAVQAPFEAGVTTVKDTHKFVKEAAGENDGGELSGDTPVVCVKFGSAGQEEWTVAFIQQLCLATGFRMVNQNEFLEAILTKNTARLFSRVLYHEDTPNADSNSAGTAQPAARPASPPKPARRALRGPVKSVFTGFDDGSDDEVFAPPPAASTQMNGTQANGFVKGEKEIKSTQNGRSHTQANGRKRAVPDSDDEEEQALREHQAHMFRGTEAMKRRRLETAPPETGNTSSGLDTRATSELVATEELPTKKKKKEPKDELDLKAALRAQREAEEAKEQERLDRNKDDHEVDGLTIEQMKNLAVIEECEVRITPRQRPDCNGDAHGPGWNPDWNGRKNFKKFRKQGTSADARRGQRVIVPLEEAKGTRSGPVGLSYSVGATASRAGRARQRSGSSDDDGEEEEEEYPQPSARRSAGAQTPRTRRSRPEGSLGDEIDDDDNVDADPPSEDEGVPETVPSNLQTGSAHEVIDVDAPRTTRAHGPATQPQVTSTQQSATMRGVKRKQAATQSSGGTMAAPKRQKKLDLAVARKPASRVQAGSGSESEDDLKFKFRRKTRG